MCDAWERGSEPCVVGLLPCIGRFTWCDNCAGLAGILSTGATEKHEAHVGARRAVWCPARCRPRVLSGQSAESVAAGRDAADGRGVGWVHKALQVGTQGEAGSQVWRHAAGRPGRHGGRAGRAGRQATPTTHLAARRLAVGGVAANPAGGHALHTRARLCGVGARAVERGQPRVDVSCAAVQVGGAGQPLYLARQAAAGRARQGGGSRRGRSVQEAEASARVWVQGG